MSDFYTDLELPTHLRSQSVALHQIGINDIAWPRDAALALLQALRAQTIAVLGGDVLRLTYDKLDHTYDNWYTNPHPNEDFAHYTSYVKRNPLSICLELSSIDAQLQQFWKSYDERLLYRP